MAKKVKVVVKPKNKGDQSSKKKKIKIFKAPFIIHDNGFNMRLKVIKKKNVE